MGQIKDWIKLLGIELIKPRVKPFSSMFYAVISPPFRIPPGIYVVQICFCVLNYRQSIV